jgi:predicted DNA-binding transcriptional regulator AlpA
MPNARPETRKSVEHSSPSGQWLRDEFCEVEEFAAVIGRQPATIWRWWRERRGPPYVMLGRRRVIPRDGAREWLRSREVQPLRDWHPR